MIYSYSFELINRKIGKIDLIINISINKMDDNILKNVNLFQKRTEKLSGFKANGNQESKTGQFSIENKN